MEDLFSSFREPCPAAGSAIIAENTLLESSTLPLHTTSQQVELVVLTRALTLKKGKRVNIYTDSKYAYHILHFHALIWQERGFLTTKGTPIVNGKLIHKLLKAAKLPLKATFIHCKGHQKATDAITKDNLSANSAAQQAALKTSPLLPIFPSIYLVYTQEEQTSTGLVLSGEEDSSTSTIKLSCPSPRNFLYFHTCTTISMPVTAPYSSS